MHDKISYFSVIRQSATIMERLQLLENWIKTQFPDKTLHLVACFRRCKFPPLFSRDF